MGDNDADEPRLFSRHWWTQTNPYWGEWRSGPWGWFYLVVFVSLLVSGAYFFNNTREGWITVAVLLSMICAGTLTARPGRRRDVVRRQRHQYDYRKDRADKG